jgi:hypothetical protein
MIIQRKFLAQRKIFLWGAVTDETAKDITEDDRARLNGYVMAIMEKSTFDPDRFVAEVRRAMSGRQRSS